MHPGLQTWTRQGLIRAEDEPLSCKVTKASNPKLQLPQTIREGEKDPSVSDCGTITLRKKPMGLQRVRHD